MSFAAQTKKELTRIELDSCCTRAELSAMISINGTVQFGNGRFVLDVVTENAAIARRIYTHIKKIYDVHVELLVRKKMRLKKNNVYVVRIPQKVKELLSTLGIWKNGSFAQGITRDFTKRSCCKRSYLRGAFLASGSVHHPEASSYHLEIFTDYVQHGEALADVSNDFHLNAKCIERKNGHIVYIKEGEKITEFLNIIGAHQALLYFEDVRIVKDMRNSVNRLVNCETANLNKTISAAMQQIDNIKLIDREWGLDQLPSKLQDVARARVEYPEANLKELGEVIPGGKVSKSGVNHRLRKINEIASKLKENTGQK